MKHYLILTSSYPTLNDGSEAAGSFVQDFAKGLSAHCKVSVISPGNENISSLSNEIEHITFKAPITPLSLLSPKNPLHWLPIFQTMFTGYRKTCSMCKSNNISHILSFWVLPSGLWAYLATKKFNTITYSCWALGSDIWSYAKFLPSKWLIRSILNSSKICFADGIILKSDVENTFNTKCVFLPSCRNITKNELRNFEPRKNDGIKLAFLGRWHHNKGIDILLNALDKLSSNSLSKVSTIKIAGGGPLRKLVESKYQELSKTNLDIELLGFLNTNEATRLITWADYLIIPSRIESIPVILSDAIQCGTPVIAMPAGDLKHVVNKYKLGIVAKSITTQALKDAIELALETPPSNFHQDLNNSIKEFSLKASVEKFIYYIQDENLNDN